MFLGVRFDMLTPPDAPVLVAEMVLPVGASPPAHVHGGLDDSFYVLEGEMVLRCGDDVTLAGPGTWVQFPSGVAHTFRVTGGGPVRALVVHANGSFMDVVREVGQPTSPDDEPSAAVGPPAGVDVEAILAAHGVTTVGPPMEEEEAQAHLQATAPAAV